MSVSFGTSGVSAASSGAVTTFSATFNIGTLTNGALLGLIFAGDGTITSLSVSSFTWNAVSMTPLVNNGDAGAGTVNLFGLQGPASGSHSMSATWTGAQTVALAFLSFNGADQTGGTTTFYNATSSIGTGSQSTRTAAQSTHSGDATAVVWALGAAQSGTESPTHDWTVAPSGIFSYFGQHQLSTSTSDSYTESMGSSDQLDFYGVSIKALATAAAEGGMLPLMGVG